MKQLCTRTGLRVLAVILALLAGTGGFFASLFTLYRWDDIWSGMGYYSSRSYNDSLYDYTMQLRRMATLLQSEKWRGALSYLDQQELDNYRQLLDPENTNFRVRLLNNATGDLLYSNLPLDTSKEALSQAVYQILYTPLQLSYDGGLSDNDYVGWDEDRTCYQVYVYLPTGEIAVYTPEDMELAAQYGWRCRDGSNWYYTQEQDSRIRSVELALEYGVADPLRAEDEFMEGYREYGEFAAYLPGIALAAVGLDALAVLAVVFLCMGAGRRRDRTEVALGWFDRIPLDLLAAGLFFAVFCLIGAGDSITWTLSNSGPGDPNRMEAVVGIEVIALCMDACLLACILTLAVRIKARVLLRNTIIWRLAAQSIHFCRSIGRSWPFTWRVAAAFGLYLTGTVITTALVLPIPLYQGLVLYGLCRWSLQWRRVREGTGRIMGGDPDFQIDTGGHMYRDLREHAAQINDLGGAISSAVEQQLKSERFKAELITNVSHDLKTPLTSIINYVDLLKKQDIQDPTAAEYIAVLDRKSQRLKKLTEDLVEASKASTGNLTVNRERLGMVQLVQQAVGEFEEKFTQSGLALVSNFPSGEVYVRADGRHLWRIIENLLSNCNKYALEGTRIYLDVLRWEGNVTLSVKNISRRQLNIPPDQLMERFVRGEESRTTEGSGLGLSIARSLAELNGGTFRLDIDGDLFKAAVTLPEDRAQLPPAPGDVAISFPPLS